MSLPSGFGRNFSRDVEAILSTVQLGAAMGETFLYPHEVRENLRMTGMRLDGKAPDLPDFTQPWVPPDDHEPDFGPMPEVEEDYEEEGTDVR